MGLLKRLEIAWKHRGQPAIQNLEGERVDSSERKPFFENAYNDIEAVRRGTDVIVDSFADIDVNIAEQLPIPTVHKGNKVQIKKLNVILNHRPNTEEDISSFRRQLATDLILTGNCYQYWDGLNLWQLPSVLMEIKTGSKKKVLKYIYDGKTEYLPYEIIHTKDNSSNSIYTGKSRLRSAAKSISTLRKMLTFRDLFFENGAVPGLILTTPNVLGDKLKQKMLEAWMRLYNPKSGAKRPIILDADLKVNPISQINFKELDFENSVDNHELKILKSLGVPPILLNSGNNANLRPNIQLFYELTVLPLYMKLISSYERFFAYDLEPDVIKIRSLQPEMRDAATFYQSLVNTGIITINEARVKLRFEPSEEEHANELRIPANIAGSAEDPSQGGRPDEGNEDEGE